MDKNTLITINKSIDVTDLAGEKVMVNFDEGKYFLIKGVGNQIWDILQEPTTPAKIIEQLMDEYEISAEECEKQVMEFLEKLETLNLLGK